MRKVLIAAGALAVIAVCLGAGLFAWAATAEYTECYGSFSSEAAAERAASAAHEKGLDARLDEENDSPTVIFETGETGSDAAGARGVFTEVLRGHDGTPAHPDGGCGERTHFD